MKTALPIDHKLFKSKCFSYIQLMRLDRPIGILLLLWPTLWALWIAGKGFPSPLLLGTFIVGVIVMRSAGCVINDYADRHYDGQVTRTRERPLVTQKITPKEALILFALLSVLATACLWPLNGLSRGLAIPAIAIAILYPFMKRYTHLPQLVLGVAFSWGVLMAFAAQTGQLTSIAWLVFFIACLWPIAYDTMYAMVDRADDERIGIKSTAILFGRWDIIIIDLLHSTMVIMGIALGIWLALGIFYYLGLLAAALLMSYQHYLLKNRQTENCFRAFLISQWVGCAIFIGLFCQYTL